MRQVFSMNEKWEFEHDEFECDRCRTREGSFNLNFYIGFHNNREAHKYSCSNEECGHEEIEYLDEMGVNEDGTIDTVQNDVGKKIVMADGHTTRILKQDKKGLYIIKGGIKNYVEFHVPTGLYHMTGTWDHKD